MMGVVVQVGSWQSPRETETESEGEGEGGLARIAWLLGWPCTGSTSVWIVLAVRKWASRLTGVCFTGTLRSITVYCSPFTLHALFFPTHTLKLLHTAP